MCGSDTARNFGSGALLQTNHKFQWELLAAFLKMICGLAPGINTATKIGWETPLPIANASHKSD